MNVKLWFRRHDRTLAYTFGPATAVGGLALATYLQYGSTAAAIEFTLTLASGAGSVAAFMKKLPQPLAWGLGALALALLQATVTSTVGFDWPAFYAWALNCGISWAATLVLHHRTRHDVHRARLNENKIDLDRLRIQTAHERFLQAQARTQIATRAPHEPLLFGDSPEDTRLRQAVWSVFKRELAPGAVRTEYLPTNDGWTLDVELPGDLSRSQLLAKAGWDRVVSAMALPGRFVPLPAAQSNRLALRYQEGDPLAATIPYEPSPARSFLEPVILGLDRFGREVTVELAYNHTLIGGSSKFGKSNLVKLICLRLADLPDSVLYGVDMKPGAPELTLMSPILHDLAQTPEQARALFDWLTAEMHERGEILAKVGDTQWVPDRHGRPVIWVVVDELGELIRQGDANVPKGVTPMSGRIESLLALARGYGIHLILATQTPSNRVFGRSTDARGNLTVRLCTRMNDSKHAQFMFSGPNYKPGALDMPGKFLMFAPEHNTGAEYRAQYVSDEMAAVEMARLSRDMVPAPIGQRAILPAPRHLNNQQAIRNRLERYGEMSRRELEAGCNLNKDQVLRALRELAPEVAQDQVTNFWSLRPDGIYLPAPRD